MIVPLTNPRNTKPGIADIAYISLLSWFAEGGLKEPAAPFVNPGDEVLIKQTHEFVTGVAGFIQFTLSPQKNNLNARAIGELMGRSLQFQVNLMVPGSYMEQHAILQQLLNKPLIAIVKDCNNSETFYYQIGSRCKPAYLVHAFQTGTEKEGAKGYQVTLSAIADAVIIYTGLVQKLHDPYINGGYPVFYEGLDVQVNNDSLSLMRSQFAYAKTVNISTIYADVVAQQETREIFLHYRNTVGDHISISINEQDLSTFGKFVDVLDSYLPAGVTLTPSGTTLLTGGTGGPEHYLSIEIQGFEYLIDADGSTIEDIDGKLLLTS